MATMSNSIPPSYAQPTHNVDLSAPHGQEFPLSYVDFLPAVIEPGGTFKRPTYERFGDLVKTANNWLQANPTIGIKTCESLEVSQKQPNSDVSVSFDFQKKPAYLRCLRLWITSKTTAETTEPQQFGYLNVVPACKDAGGFSSMPTFDTFDETVSKLNATLSAQPLPGRILNMETKDVTVYSWKGSLDPDESYWLEYGNTVKSYLSTVRLFYENGPPAHEQIGCVDFLPACTQQLRFLKPLAFEPFSAVVLKAQEWIVQHPTLQVASVQSIDYNIHHTRSVELDTQRTLFSESGDGITCCVPILRICYVSGASHPRRPLTAIACKTFTPCRLSQHGTFSAPTFETQSETMKRALAWLQATGAKVISAETVPLRRGLDFQFNSDFTLTARGKVAHEKLLVLRVHLDGFYAEPPSGVLPPVPVMDAPLTTGCCTLL